jgi:hypothetical protein
VHDALVTRLVFSWGMNDEALGMLERRFPAVVSVQFMTRCFPRHEMTDEWMRAVCSSLPALTSLDLTPCWKVTDEGVRAVRASSVRRRRRRRRAPTPGAPLSWLRRCMCARTQMCARMYAWVNPTRPLCSERRGRCARPPADAPRRALRWLTVAPCAGIRGKEARQAQAVGIRQHPR